MACLLFLASGARGATGAGGFEPNDGLDTAYGPLAAGPTYSETITASADEDDYYFYVTGPDGADVQVNVNDPTAGDNGVYVELDDADGNMIDSIDVFGTYDQLDDQLGPGKYFVSVGAEFDDQIDPGLQPRAQRRPGRGARHHGRGQSAVQIGDRPRRDGKDGAGAGAEATQGGPQGLGPPQGPGSPRGEEGAGPAARGDRGDGRRLRPARLSISGIIYPLSLSLSLQTREIRDTRISKHAGGRAAARSPASKSSMTRSSKKRRERPRRS